MKFKVGDRVRLLRPDVRDLKTGQTGVIKEVATNNAGIEYIYVSMDHEEDSSFMWRVWMSRNYNDLALVPNGLETILELTP